MENNESISDALRRRYGVLTEEICRRHGVWGLHFGRLQGRDGHFFYCEECLVPWFIQGLHASDCSQRPRRLPLGFKVKVVEKNPDT